MTKVNFSSFFSHFPIQNDRPFTNFQCHWGAIITVEKITNDSFRPTIVFYWDTTREYSAFHSIILPVLFYHRRRRHCSASDLSITDLCEFFAIISQFSMIFYQVKCIIKMSSSKRNESNDFFFSSTAVSNDSRCVLYYYCSNSLCHIKIRNNSIGVPLFIAMRVCACREFWAKLSR